MTTPHDRRSETPGEAEATVPGVGSVRTLGFTASDIGGGLWLPDAPDEMSKALLADGRPFNGAFVPLVIHQPDQAERTYDAAEWAADLIAGEQGRLFCVTPFAKKMATVDLTKREWNHTAALLERLDDLCGRFGLTALVADRVGDRPARPDGTALDVEQPVHFVLDAGRFLQEGYSPTILRSPAGVDLDA